MSDDSGTPVTIKIATPSAMSLFLEMKFNGMPLATGTGFITVSSKGPVLVTNRHNVTGRRQDNDQPLSKTGGVPNELIIIHNVKDQLGNWRGCREPLYDGLQPRWIEHPTLGRAADMVALPLTQLDDVALYAYDPSKPGPDIAIGPADIVSVIGFPFGIEEAARLESGLPDLWQQNRTSTTIACPFFLLIAAAGPGSPVLLSSAIELAGW